MKKISRKIISIFFVLNSFIFAKNFSYAKKERYIDVMNLENPNLNGYVSLDINVKNSPILKGFLLRLVDDHILKEKYEELKLAEELNEEKGSFFETVENEKISRIFTKSAYDDVTKSKESYKKLNFFLKNKLKLSIKKFIDTINFNHIEKTIENITSYINSGYFSNFPEKERLEKILKTADKGEFIKIGKEYYKKTLEKFVSLLNSNFAKSVAENIKIKGDFIFSKLGKRKIKRELEEMNSYLNKMKNFMFDFYKFVPISKSLNYFDRTKFFKTFEKYDYADLILKNFKNSGYENRKKFLDFIKKNLNLVCFKNSNDFKFKNNITQKNKEKFNGYFDDILYIFNELNFHKNLKKDIYKNLKYELNSFKNMKNNKFLQGLKFVEDFVLLDKLNKKEKKLNKKIILYYADFWISLKEKLLKVLVKK